MLYFLPWLSAILHKIKFWCHSGPYLLIKVNAYDNLMPLMPVESIDISKQGDGMSEATKFPEWLKVKSPTGVEYNKIKTMVKDLKLSTVCEEARCPNIEECWNQGTATIMLMGEICTRACKFCAVKTGNPKGFILETEEQNVVSAVSAMKLKYIVLTSVNRDDLPDEGSSHFANVVSGLKQNDPNLIVEVLVPDFSNRDECIDRILVAAPHVYGHNMETVERMTPMLRDRRASYAQSLSVLSKVKQRAPDMYTKSALLIGAGETDEEIMKTLVHLREIGCDIVTMGQYLSPSKRHAPVKRYVSPQHFIQLKREALKLGFVYVAAGPFVRSSYKAAELFMTKKIRSELGIRDGLSSAELALEAASVKHVEA
jgi:lipoic acid synthetase